METQLANFRGQLREKELREESLNWQLIEKNRQKENSQRQLREMEQQLTRCQGQLREKELEEANLLGRLRDKEQQEGNTHRQLTRMEQQLREKDIELENLERLSREREQQLTYCKEQLWEKELHEASLHEQLEGKSQQRENSQRQLRELEQQLREKDVQGESLQRQLRDVEQQLRERGEHEETLQRQLRERDRELTHLQGQFEEKEDETDGLQRQVSTLEEQLTTKNQQLRELEKTLTTAQQALTEQRRQQSSDWVIPREQMRLMTDKVLGRGAWGSVVEGKYCGCAVAVKQIHELILSPHNRTMFEREMDIASRCRHPCLLQFIGATNDEGSPLFVTELMETSLRALLEQRSLSETEVSTISLDVARALSYLHHKTPAIIHRDISSANVLLWRQGNQWRGKVSDYGAANVMQHTMTVGPGNAIYTAPEALTPNQTVKVSVLFCGIWKCWILGREENRRTRRKTFGARIRTNNILNPHLTPGPGIKPGSDWR